jgi:thiamine pyrophosphate-dependent acetolactate synthase large subunit-like protein
VTWGAQALSGNLSNCLGLFGTHSPGLANEAIKEATYVLVLGASLLQHQCGKDYSKFAPNARIDYVNNVEGECRRAYDFFNERIHTINCDYQLLLGPLKNYNLPAKECPEKSQNLIQFPAIVSRLACIFQAFAENMGTHIYADAGATLSWSFQAANLLNPSTVKLFTAFNLHPMGYSNCAAVGANHGGIPSMAVIGDGSLPMNCQELAHVTGAERLKLVIVDNAGYGIIRQTQDDFYEGHHFGSSFDSLAALPKFSIENILIAFGLCYTIVGVDDVDSKCANDFIKSTEINALIIKIPLSDRVTTYTYS